MIFPRHPALKHPTHIHIELVVIILLAMLILSIALSSCAIVQYTGTPNGETQVSIYTLGSDKIIQDFNASITSNGERKLSIGDLQENQTEGMKQMNAFVQSIVAGAVQGAK